MGSVMSPLQLLGSLESNASTKEMYVKP
jgi:hypothetical protein